MYPYFTSSQCCHDVLYYQSLVLLLIKLQMTLDFKSVKKHSVSLTHSNQMWKDIEGRFWQTVKGRQCCSVRGRVLKELLYSSLWFSHVISSSQPPWRTSSCTAEPLFWSLRMDAYADYLLYDYYNETVTDNGSLDFNITVDCPSSYLHGANIFLPVLYCIIFFTGFLGNLFVISVVGNKGRRGGRLVDTFVVNLALADLVFVLTLPLWAISASQGGYWDFGPTGNLLCKLSSYIIAVNRFSNIFFLTCMSVDRYLAVVKLMDSRYLRSSQCIRATCAAIWLSSLVLGIPSLVYRRVELSGDGLSCVEDDNSYFFLSLGLAMALLTFIFPVLIIVLCYGTIIVHLNKHCVATANPRSEARRRHSLKMVLSIIVAFVVSWLPFNIFKVIIIGSQLSKVDLNCGAPSWQRNGLLISCCLAFLNSCVNPAIYFFLDNHFRRRAEILFKTCMGKPKLLQSHNSSASCTNVGTSESFGTTGGRTQLQTFE